MNGKEAIEKCNAKLEEETAKQASRESPWNGTALGAAAGGYGIAQLIQEAETDMWRRRYFEVMNKIERLTLQAFLLGVISGALWVGVLWYVG